MAEIFDKLVIINYNLNPFLIQCLLARTLKLERNIPTNQKNLV